MDERTKDTDDRDPDVIRRDIERTRADMDETVEELSERLSPGRLVDEAWSRLREGDGLGAVLRDHPVPVALMGLGLGWLAVEQATGRKAGERDPHDPHRWESGSQERAEGRRGPYRGDAISRDDEADVEESGTGIGEKVSRLAGSGTRAARSAAEGTRHAAERVKDEVGEKAGEAAESLRHGAHAARSRVSNGFWSTLEESPLTVGAIAFGLGLAGGLSAPSTPLEDRMMGRSAGALKEETGRVVKESAGKVKRVAEDAADAAVDEYRHQREERDLGGAANEIGEAAGYAAGEAGAATKEVARAARRAATRRAAEEELDAEGLKREAKVVAERTAHPTGSTPRKRPRRSTKPTGDDPVD